MRINQPYGVRYDYEEFSVEPKKRYFIACEGKKTEYKYFKGIMDNKVEIKINPLIEIIPILNRFYENYNFNVKIF